ncbi:MAG TPA: helix-turn-helix domain-containing protein [Ktedonobacterales bacterium]|nr:helix-turn-helix domain-containing protein [Ktedonobacterales bacterium]
MSAKSPTPIRRPNVESPLCPIFHDAVELIGRRWNGAILYVLMRGPHRYHELLTAIPNLSDRVLTVRLRELEANELISRTVEPGPPVKVSYQLTPAGQDLNAVIDAIGAWGHKWREQASPSEGK